MLGRHFSECYYSEYIVWPSATHSISSSATANICTCLTQAAEVLAPLLGWWTDPQLHMPPNCLRAGVCKEGYAEASHSQKNIYHAGATVTNQWRLENMISPGEECESWGALQGCRISREEKEAMMGIRGLRLARAFRCSGGMDRHFQLHPLMRQLFKTLKEEKKRTERVDLHWKKVKWSETILSDFFGRLFKK